LACFNSVTNLWLLVRLSITVCITFRNNSGKRTEKGKSFVSRSFRWGKKSRTNKPRFLNCYLT
jgi:hypothetical protein